MTGRGLTTRQKIGDRTAVYRRRSGERQGLTGEWSLTSASVTTVAIESADGFDLVFSSGGATCKANFDGRDYPIIEPGGRASTVETDTFTVSDDARTLTHAGGAPGQPPASTLVYDRQ